MKKVWLLVVMLFLAACGSGGSGGGTTAPGGQVGGSAIGSLSLQFVDKTAKALAIAVPDPGWIRVVVSNPNLNGVPYKQIQDIPFGGANVEMSLPVGTGYTAEAVYYSKSGGRNQMSDYGLSAPFAIVENQRATEAVGMGDITVSMAVSDGAVYSTAPSNTYTVTATIGNVGLQPNWSLAVNTAAFTVPVHLARVPAASYTLAAPVTYQPSTLHFQGEFFIKPSLLSSGESVSNWTFHYDAPTTKDLLIHSGSTEIDPPGDDILPRVTSFAVPTSIQGTTTIAPLSIVGTDNVAIIGYKITESPTAPAWGTPGTDGWSATKPTSYLVSAAPVHGVDSSVTLYAWVEDYVNVSEAVAGVSVKTAVINDSPVVTGFTIPLTDTDTIVPVSVFTGKNNTGLDGALSYLITEAVDADLRPIPPLASDANWSAAGVPPASYTVTGFAQAAGGRYAVPLYAWVKDANDSISRSLSNYITISDAPEVTAFVVPAEVAGTIVPITTFTGAAAPGHTVEGYLITKTSSVPPASAFSAAKPIEFNYTGLVPGGNRYLYAWVIDERGIISLSRSAAVRFLAP